MSYIVLTFVNRILFRRLLPLAFTLSYFDLCASAQLTVIGVIRAREEVTVRSEVSGIVQRIAVHEGDHVREDQLLVELRNERQRIALDLSKARLAKAFASVEETKVVLDNAEKELSRVKIAADALPRKEVEDKTDQVLRIRANLNAQQADVSQSAEEVKLRENELKETQLQAPFAGTVTQIHINRGDALRPMDTQVLELVALEDLYVELLLPSSYIQRVRPDQKMMVQIEDYPGLGRLEGKVIYVNPKVDASSRTFKVKIQIPNANDRVRPGMLAEVRFEP
jgi:RND family efflux transporter MFP subunit